VSLIYPPSGLLLEPDASHYRDAMSRVAGAVHIVTTTGKAGQGGFTATAVASVSDTPPTLLVCVNRSSRSAALLKENGLFCVNTLGAKDIELANVFAGRAGLVGEQRFLKGNWSVQEGKPPLLLSALVAMQCKIIDLRPVATHDIIIGEALNLWFGEVSSSLVYFNRDYHSL
jgi:flavin reductase